MSVDKYEKTRYSVQCHCGHTMRVRRRHFGRLCRCKNCQYPIYVSADNVQPPLSPADKNVFRCFEDAEAPPNWETGDLIADLYEVMGTLGSGGMGVVYRVYHRGWNTDLAVKSPLSKVLRYPEWVDRFVKECQTWINLEPHPNTVCCHYVRALGGVPRIFAEYVEGSNLGRQITKRWLYFGGPQASLPRILDIGIQFAWGLYHAHRSGVIHLDVKPNNVLLANDGRVKVTDFGISKLAGESDSESDGEQCPVGTPLFRSPEHEQPEIVTAQSDVWSWALSMLAVFCGGAMWQHGCDARAALDRLVSQGPPRPEIPRIPDMLADLLAWCFNEDSSQRPKDMLVVAGVLKQVFEEVMGAPYPREDPTANGLGPDRLNNRAVSLLDLGQDEESEILWSKVLSQNPKHLETQYNRLLHAWWRGTMTDLRLFHSLYRMCETRKRDWRPRCFLARALVEMGDCKSALKILESIAHLSNRERDVAFALAIAQNKKPHAKRMIGEFRAHSTPVTAVALSHNGLHAITGCLGGRARLWDLAQGKCLAVLDAHEGRVTAAGFSPDGKLALTAGEDGTIYLWSVENGTCVHALECRQGPVRCAAFTTDGKRVISGGDDGTVRFWHAHLAECLNVCEGHAAGVTCVAVSANGRTAASGGLDQLIKIWSLHDGKCLETILGNSNTIGALDMGGNPRLALVGAGPKVKLCDTEDKRLLRSFHGHSSEVASVSVTADGRFGLSASIGGTLKLWDLQLGQCLRTLGGRAPACLSKNGQYGISASSPGHVRLWALHCAHPTFPAPYMLCREQVLESEPGTHTPTELAPIWEDVSELLPSAHL